MNLRAGDLLYIPAEVYVYRFDEHPDHTSREWQPTPRSAWALRKPTSALLLTNEDTKSIWLKISHNGENVYVDKHDVKDYQEL